MGSDDQSDASAENPASISIRAVTSACGRPAIRTPPVPTRAYAFSNWPRRT